MASRCDNDTTHQLRRDSGPRLRQLLIIDGNQALGLASNCITGHFSIAICESCGDVCRVAINRHCSERQRPHTPLSDCLYFFFCEGNWCRDNISVLQGKDFTTSFKIAAPVHGLIKCAFWILYTSEVRTLGPGIYLDGFKTTFVPRNLGFWKPTLKLT